MGQKVNPIGFRIGINKKQESTWFATGEEYVNLFHEDMKLRKYIFKRLKESKVSKVTIQRKSKSITINIHTARPGRVIGEKGSEINKLKSEINVLVNKGKKNKKNIFLNVKEIKNAWLDAKLVGEEIADQILQRGSFRRSMKFAMSNAMKNGAKGISIQTSGRLGGAEMARTERYHEGGTPLHTLRADIDYHLTKVNTTYGIIGIKVWIYKGDILE